jgi:hypothetical protein
MVNTEGMKSGVVTPSYYLDIPDILYCSPNHQQEMQVIQQKVPEQNE